MKITEDVRKFGEKGLETEEAIAAGMKEKSSEFTEQGGEIYSEGPSARSSPSPADRRVAGRGRARTGGGSDDQPGLVARLNPCPSECPVMSDPP